MRSRQVGKTRDLMQIVAAVVGSAAAAQAVVPPHQQRGNRLACPFYRHDDPQLAAAGLSLKQHVNACPHWHQNGAESLRRPPIVGTVSEVVQRAHRAGACWCGETHGRHITGETDE